MTFILEEERPSDSPLIEKIWRTHSGQTVDFTSRAESYSEIVFEKFEGKVSATVRGPESKASDAIVPAGGEWMGVVFKLGTFMPELLPKSIMDRRERPLLVESDKKFWLDSSVWEIPTYENVDTFIERLVRQELLVYDPVVEAVLKGQPQDLSRRAVQYHFVRSTGLTQNAIQQIERAKKAMTLLREGTSIVDTVFEAGYFDQPHLTRSMKRYIGRTPLQIIEANMPGTLLLSDTLEDIPEFP